MGRGSLPYSIKLRRHREVPYDAAGLYSAGGVVFLGHDNP